MRTFPAILAVLACACAQQLPAEAPEDTAATEQQALEFELDIDSHTTRPGVSPLVNAVFTSQVPSDVAFSLQPDVPGLGVDVTARNGSAIELMLDVADTVDEGLYELTVTATADGWAAGSDSLELDVVLPN